MKLFSVLLLLLSAQISLLAQENKSNDYFWVDSVFQENFRKMDYAANSDKMFDNYVDRKFVLILISLSGIDCNTMNYSGFPAFTIDKFRTWINWYNNHKCKISKQKYIWAYSILSNPNRTDLQLDSLYHKSRITDNPVEP